MAKKISIVALLSFAAMLTVSCVGTRDLSGMTKVTMWVWGDVAETNVFQKLAKDYTNNNKDNIYIDFQKKDSDGYDTTLRTALTGRQGPDIFYVGDASIKRYAGDNNLEDLSRYIKDSTIIDTNDIWPSLMDRYQFDTNTYLHDDSAPIWGLPKDIGPTVIFYNEDALTAQNIKVISAKDDDNDGKVTYQGQQYDARGYDPENKVFNNKIAMTTDELGEISKLLNHSNAIPSKHQTRWTFYSSWWFWAGWSVGGDCIQFHETDDPSYYGGYWEFTLDDTHKNYRVNEDMTLNEHSYKKGEFVDYYDLPFMETYDQTASLVAEGKLNELPSINSAFDYWINFFYNGTSPKPSDFSSELGLFTNQEVAMYVTGRYNTLEFRRDCSFAWDCAPLPIFEGGTGGGHSTSMCVSMNKNCKNKPEAFKVIEYFCGPEGQDALAATGFNVPSQISVTNDPNGNFLKSTERPYNKDCFLDAVSYQKAGDWSYLKDDAWINIWAPYLNGDVINGKATQQELFAKYKTATNNKLKEYTRR